MNMFTLSVLFSTFLQAQPDVANRFNGYLILGYVVMWLIASAYVISLVTRRRNLQGDIQLMKELLRDDEEAGD